MSKVLIYDIENMALLGYAWQLYDTNIIKTVHDQHFLTFAWKWLGEKKINALSLADFPEQFKKDPHNDVELIKVLHKLYDEADIVIAHNGNSFDQKMATGRFIYHRLGPAAPYQQVDTLRISRKLARFPSHKLDDLSEMLGHGKKIKTDFDLWYNVDHGDPKAIKQMIKYNKRDVELLEMLYKELRPYDTAHPNMAALDGRPKACPACLEESVLHSAGYKITAKGIRYKRYQCQKCGRYCNERTADKSEDKTTLV